MKRELGTYLRMFRQLGMAKKLKQAIFYANLVKDGSSIGCKQGFPSCSQSPVYIYFTYVED